MAKLYLKFEDRVIQEVPLAAGVVTIGRQPDNILRIDNPAVSGHHAKVYAEGDHFVLEDAESFNGTYLNDHRIGKVILKDGDKALIGKHTIEFWGDRSEDLAAPHGPAEASVVWQEQTKKPTLPQLDRTAVLDTAKLKEMLAHAAAASGGPGAMQTMSIAEKRPLLNAEPVVRQTMGTLTIVEGRTDQAYYVLTGKLTVIGKSEMAGIRLRKWFAPRVAASIYRAEDGYFIAASGDNVKLKVNDTLVAGGQQLLESGDIIEVAGITAVFGFCEG
jgi:predicted component of type VI protein secretion system